MSISFCLPHHVAVSVFNICSGLCTEMLRMCVLYVSFGSKVRPIIFGCSVVYLEVQIALIFCRVWSEQSASCFIWI